jgi:hypothetical protein
MTEVITARGERLNMDELKRKHRRPIMPPEVASTVTRQAQPPRQANIRGFMPSMEGVARRVGGEPKPAPQIVDGPSVADYTGVTVDRLKHLEARPDDAVTAANQTLTEIISDLQTQTPPPPDTPVKGRRSRQS